MRPDVGSYSITQLVRGDFSITPYDRRLNPYINRMAQDMHIRNLATSRFDSLTGHDDKFWSQFGKIPEEHGLEEIRHTLAV